MSELGQWWVDEGTLVSTRSRPPVPLGDDLGCRLTPEVLPGPTGRAGRLGVPALAGASGTAEQGGRRTAPASPQADADDARRPFEFRAAVKKQARLRQLGRCACCGESLDHVEEHAHHVFPNQSGVRGDGRHAWLASTDNCAVLCALCHERVHEDGRYQRGAVAPPGYYPHSHGDNLAAHRGWVQHLERQARSLWP